MRHFIPRLWSVCPDKLKITYSRDEKLLFQSRRTIYASQLYTSRNNTNKRKQQQKHACMHGFKVKSKNRIHLDTRFYVHVYISVFCFVAYFNRYSAGCAIFFIVLYFGGRGGVGVYCSPSPTHARGFALHERFQCIVRGLHLNCAKTYTNVQDTLWSRCGVVDKPLALYTRNSK